MGAKPFTDHRTMGRREISIGLVLLISAVATDRFSINIGGLNLRVELIVGGLVALWALYRARPTVLPARKMETRGVTSEPAFVEIGLLGWLAANVVSSLFFSPDVRETAKFAVIIVGLITLYAGAIMLMRTGEAVTWAALAWVVVGIGVALVGLVQALLYTFYGSTAGIQMERAFQGGVFTVTPRVQSLIWEPNILGSYSLTVVAMAWALGHAPAFGPGASGIRQLRGWQWLFTMATAFSYCSVILSMTRTVWVLGLITLPLLLGMSAVLGMPVARRELLRWTAAGLAGAAVGLLVGSFFMPTLSWKAVDPMRASYEQVEHAVTSIISGHGLPPPPLGPQALPGNPAGAGDPTGAQQLAGALTPGQAGKSSTFLNKVQEAASAEKASSFVNRKLAVTLAFEGWLSRPLLGWGTGAFATVYPPAPGVLGWIPNLELHTLFDTGVIGLFFLGLAGVAAWMRGVRALLTPVAGWNTTHYVLFGLLSSAILLLVAYQITDGIWLGITWMVFAMMVAATRACRL